MDYILADEWGRIIAASPDYQKLYNLYLEKGNPKWRIINAYKP